MEIILKIIQTISDFMWGTPMNRTLSYNQI